MLGVIDGTHLGPSTRPENCGEECFTRKGQYAISALIIVDDKKVSDMQILDGPGAYMMTIFGLIPGLFAIHNNIFHQKNTELVTLPSLIQIS